MSVVSAPFAAVRLPRPASGRRALLTAVFLGGLLALAFLFGGSAHAAQQSAGDRPVTAGAVDSLSGVAEKAGTAADLAGDSITGTLRESTGRVTGEGAETDRNVRHSRAGRTGQAGAAHGTEAAHAAETPENRGGLTQLYRTTGETTRAVTGELTGLMTKSVESTKGLTRPVGDTVSGVTGSLPLERLTGALVPCGDSPGTGSGHAHDPAGGGHHAEHTGRDAAHAAEQPEQHTAHAPLPAGAPALSALGQDSTHDTPGGPADDGPSPLQHLPGSPASPSQHSAGDGKDGPRQLAAYMTDMERPHLLRPGAVSTEHGTPTRERSAEIPEFPG